MLNNYNKIGRKVYRLCDIGDGYIVPKKTHEIVRAIDDGRTFGYTLKDEAGREVEVKWWEVVFVPDENLPEDIMIQRYLSDNGVEAEVFVDATGEVCVSIGWGDWKHSHAWADYLMSFIDYRPSCEPEVTEEDGSDCYSADHYYHKTS